MTETRAPYIIHPAASVVGSARRQQVRIVTLPGGIGQVYLGCRAIARCTDTFCRLTGGVILTVDEMDAVAAAWQDWLMGCA
jgi:hypothetical protein